MQLTIQLALAILTEAGLSLSRAGGAAAESELGPDAGGLRRRSWPQAPHLAIVPGLAIALTVLGLNLLGDGLRDRLDPRLRGDRAG